MVPSARVVNHSGMLGDPRVVGGALQGEVERHLQVELVGPLDERVEVGEGAQLGVHGVVPARLDPTAHGEPGSSKPAIGALSRPLRRLSPIGWMGGRQTTSKPMAATASRRFAAVRSVPACTEPSDCRTAPSDRGNISYQAPTSARSRSTNTG